MLVICITYPQADSWAYKQKLPCCLSHDRFFVCLLRLFGSIALGCLCLWCTLQRLMSVSKCVSYPWLSGCPKAKLLNRGISPVSQRNESFRGLYVKPAEQKSTAVYTSTWQHICSETTAAFLLVYSRRPLLETSSYFNFASRGRDEKLPIQKFLVSKSTLVTSLLVSSWLR